MRAIGRRNTKPELIVRRHLHAHGMRFRVDVGALPGRPDVVLRRWNAAIMVHGCFWHRHPGCRYASTPSSNVHFWESKFRRNVERDARSLADLRGAGWRVAVMWECALRPVTRDRALADLVSWIASGSCELHCSDEAAPPVFGS